MKTKLVAIAMLIGLTQAASAQALLRETTRGLDKNPHAGLWSPSAKVSDAQESLPIASKDERQRIMTDSLLEETERRKIPTQPVYVLSAKPKERSLSSTRLKQDYLRLSL